MSNRTNSNYHTRGDNCLNCGGRGSVGGRMNLPDGSSSTKTTCYMCKGSGHK